MTLPSNHPLFSLAEFFGVETYYYAIDGSRMEAQPEILLQVLKSMGAPLEKEEEAERALRECLRQRWERVLEPMVVPSPGTPLFSLRLPLSPSSDRLTCQLALESGESSSWEVKPDSIPAVERVEVEGVPFELKNIPLPEEIPEGYHRLTVEVAGRSYEATLVQAPKSAFGETPFAARWGVFAPLYGIHSRRSWGAGDFTDLGRLAGWLGTLGGSVVSTLPLLPTFLEEPLEYSPYSSLSRLFLNEFYLDPEILPEFKNSPAAQKQWASSEFQKKLERLRGVPLVDYREIMALKRGILQTLAESLLVSTGKRREEFQNFVRQRPLLEEYARFRAAVEKCSRPWRGWNEALKQRRIGPGDFSEASRHYHQYVQWAAQSQLESLARRTGAGDTLLALDYPVGVHPDGFDVWRYPEIFAAGVSAGAPPDYFFQEGQDWGFPPLHPQKIREDGYGYFRDTLRHHFRFGKLVRIDHIMGFHRLFWVPHGRSAKEGVYVRYAPEEFYAILCLESSRHHTTVVGEDLGTVSVEVRPAMKAHGLLRSFVVQVEPGEEGERKLPEVPREAVASLNTHDMPTFAAFWGDRPDPEEALRRSLLHLASSPAEVVLVNLEDLWLEREGQNVPGTGYERPNWRRKLKFSLEEISRNEAVRGILQDIARARSRKSAEEKS